MRKIVVFILSLIILILIYNGYNYKNTEYIKNNYLKLKTNLNIINIEKISLKEIVKDETITSKNINDVVMFKEFGRPNIKNTNTIIGAHSGIGRKAKFKDLEKISINDKVQFYYKEKEYNYVVIEKFFVHEKDLTVLNNIRNKTTLTLLTCNSLNDEYRLIVILELDWLYVL